MAGQGSLYLSNTALNELYTLVKSCQPTLQDALYSQYKNAYKLSVSNYFRGDAADAFKGYLSAGTVNLITGFLELTADMTMIIQFIAELFFQYESTHGGKVAESALDYIEKSLPDMKDNFHEVRDDINTILASASQYITKKALMDGSVEAQYSTVESNLKNIRTDLYSVDGEAKVSAQELYDKILALKEQLTKTREFCYNSDGVLDANRIGCLSAQDWYQRSGNLQLYMMLQEDPFEYSAGAVSVAEDQWAAGLCADVYAYAGYSFLSASYEAGVEDGTAFVKAKAAVLSANGYAQFTDYLRASANLRVGFAEGEAKAGFSDKYVGFKVEAEVGVIAVDGSIVLGSEDLNAFVKGEAKVLCADGKVAFELEEDGQFAIGVDASATLASASVKGGTTILGYKSKDNATGEEETLLGFNAGVKADAGVGITLWAESKTALETDFVNINATTVKIDAAFLLGVDLSITVPTPYFKWPF